MSKYPYLLFDADDTLLDFSRNGQRAFTLLCAKYHFPCNEASHALFEEFNQSMWRALERGTITKEYLKVERFRLFLDALHRQEDPVAVNEDFMAFLGASSFLMPHAEEVCRILSQTHKLYILTNSVESVHTSRMAQSLLTPYIEASFVSEVVGYEKPSRFFFDHVLAQIPGITRENCLLIGDSLTSDIQGGINAGLDTCWLNRDHAENPGQVNPTYEIDQLEQLYQIVMEPDELARVGQKNRRHQV